MAFLIEDGSVIAGANSYVSAANARAYALDRGVTLSANDTTLQSQLVKACDYLQSLEQDLQGERYSIDQSLMFPRIGVYLNNVLIANNVIPLILIQAQIQLAIILNSGFDLLPVLGPSSYILKEKIGPIETEYANPLQTGIRQKFDSVTYLLNPLMNQKGFSLKTVRI